VVCAPEGQWILGNHPEATPEQMQKLLQVLEQAQGCVCLQPAGFANLCGPLGPASFQLKEDKPMWQGQRQDSEEELKIGDKAKAE